VVVGEDVAVLGDDDAGAEPHLLALAVLVGNVAEELPQQRIRLDRSRTVLVELIETTSFSTGSMMSA
jgi:hypothetical protein